MFLLDYLAHLPAVGQTVLVLSLIGGLGLLIGRLSFKGVSLGIGGVLFAGLAAGDLLHRAGLALDTHALEFIREFGLILFVYTIGVQVGPGFFSAFQRVGARLNLLAVGLVLSGVAVAVVLQRALDLPLPAVLGILSGAVTNTPSLGATQQALADLTPSADLLAMPGLGYAVAYPFGILGVLLTMIGIRAFFRIDPLKLAADLEAKRLAETAHMATLDVVVENYGLDGLILRQLPGAQQGELTVSRLMRHGQLQVPHDTTRLEQGDILHLVGPREALEKAQPQIGPAYTTPLTTKGTRLTWDRLIVTNEAVLGQTLNALDIEGRHDVRISRVDRAGVELVAHAGVRLQFGDVLTVIGRKPDILAAATTLGNSSQRLKKFDPVPLFLGIVIGIVLGAIAFPIPGLAAPVKLGMAGGPLVAAIVLSRLGNIGRLVWFMPPGSLGALRELGIVLFLAVVGYHGGGRLVETLTEGDGLVWLACGVAITLIPQVIVGLVGYLVAKLDYLTLCGLLAGSVTDPPALAFAEAMAPESQVQSQAYAAVYPLVMFLRILIPQALLIAMW